ncbi:hypothetical protein niasHT_004020 [Heterodera trifolii]|uniref:DNA helicase Pif1-like 2B domain-containing protein n=1 Tax=Heterodera trifolii TaxID=157864 RepID=A0ABD2LT71_9BILA
MPSKDRSRKELERKRWRGSTDHVNDNERNWLWTKQNPLANADAIANNAVLCPTNNDVQYINEIALARMSGDAKGFPSIDEPLEPNEELHNFRTDFNIEAVHNEMPSGMPPHKMVLKVGTPVMLVRNLDVTQGLCNGTRLQVMRMAEDCLFCRILTGPRADAGHKIEVERSCNVNDGAGVPIMSMIMNEIGCGQSKVGTNQLLIPPPLLLPNLEEAIQFCFPEGLFTDPLANADAIANNAVLFPTNNDVQYINEIALARMSGDAKGFPSIDEPLEPNEELHNFRTDFNIEAVHNEMPSGMPPHKMVLKVGTPVMLVRNLDVTQGLCNGTRLQVMRMAEDCLFCRILTGPRADAGHKIEVERSWNVNDGAGVPIMSMIMNEIGCGQSKVGTNQLLIPPPLLLPNLEEAIQFCFPEGLFTDPLANADAIANNAVLCPTNNDVQYINEIALARMSGDAKGFPSIDEPLEPNEELHNFRTDFNIEAVHNEMPSGMPPHKNGFEGGDARNVSPKFGRDPRPVQWNSAPSDAHGRRLSLLPDTHWTSRGCWP